MRTNDASDIHDDWNLTSQKIVKPKHLNALTRSVQYDYVITGATLEGKSGTVDVDELLGGNVVNGVTGECRILVNTNVPDNITLYFPADSVGGPSGTLKVHVYTVGPFKASLGQSGIPNIIHYFHTHGEIEAVTLVNASHNMYVGSFVMASAVELGPGSSFTYEAALGALPVPASGATVAIMQKSWMTNGDIGVVPEVPITHAIAVMLDYLRLGPENGGVPSNGWPLYCRWKATPGGSDTFGAIAARAVFPEGTTPGTLAGEGYLVPRNKPEYGGALLPMGLTDAVDGPIQFRNGTGAWSASGYDFFTYGFVLNNTFFGCSPARHYSGVPMGVKVTGSTTQLDMYITLGLVLGNTGALLPVGIPTEYEINVDDMAEGQVIELNMHIVGFSPARQGVNLQLGPEHFIGEWYSGASYSVGDLVSVTTTNPSTGAQSYSFYRAIAGDQQAPNVNHAPGQNVGTWWEVISCNVYDNTGVFHAATPFNSGRSAQLKFIADEAASAPLTVVAWGYGTPPDCGGPQANANNVLRVSFKKPADVVSYPGTLTGEVPTIPIVASAKVIFTRITQGNDTSVLVLTGGYTARQYPDY